MRPSSRPHRPCRGGFALLSSVLLLALLLSVAMQLAVSTSVEAVVAGRSHRGLKHDLAVDSTLAALTDLLGDDSDRTKTLIERLDQEGVVNVAFEIGDTHADCRITDDGARFDPAIFQDPQDARKLTRALDTLLTRAQLAEVRFDLKPLVDKDEEEQPTRYCWYDQLFSDVDPGSIFRLEPANQSLDPRPVWSDSVTFWASGRVDVRRASLPVLQAALSDLRPGLARQMLARRPRNRAVDFTQSVLTAVEAEHRDLVAQRITYNARRYTIELTTRIEHDARRWYVVASITEDDTVVHHRSRITW